MSKSRWLARVVMVLVGTCLGVGIIELGVRMLPPNAAAQTLFNAHENAPAGLYMNDHKVAFRPTPGFQGSMKSLGYEVDIRVNELGLRGPAVQRDPRPVWLALGDSFTFAAQVPEEQSFVGLLGEELDVQLLNGGSDGHGTHHELARFRQLEKALSPEVVLVVFFTGNDFQNNVNWRSSLAGAKKRPDQEAPRAQSKPPLRSFLNRNSFLWGMVQMQIRARSFADASKPEVQGLRGDMSIFHSSGEQVLQDGIEATRTPMQGLRDRVQRRGGQLMVAVASPAYAVEDHRTKATFELVGLDLAGQDLDAPEGAVLELLEDLDIPGCALDSDLREAYAQGERPYLAFDGHWSASGHRVVAKTLSTCLSEQGFGGQEASKQGLTRQP